MHTRMHTREGGNENKGKGSSQELSEWDEGVSLGPLCPWVEFSLVLSVKQCRPLLSEAESTTHKVQVSN